MNLSNSTSPSDTWVKCIHHLIEEQVSRTPEKTALIFENQKLTYQELNDKANQLAHYLIAKGVRPGDIVGLYLSRSIELQISLLAVLKCGAAYTPLDPQYPFARLSEIANDAGLKLLIAKIGTTPSHKITEVQLVFTDAWENSAWANEPTANPTVKNLSSQNLAHLLYTSGSTGKPKGVEIEHGSVVNFLESFKSILDFSENEILLSVTGLTFDIAGLDNYLTWMSGATLFLVPRETVFDGDKLRLAVEQSRATVLQTTPVTWRALLNSGWKSPDGFKALCGGEMMPKKLLEDFAQQKNLKLWNLYGPTETTIWSTYALIHFQNELGAKRISVGTPIANTEIVLLDELLQQSAAGTVGEVAIGGLGLARGYHGLPALTGEKFITFAKSRYGKVYRTGDLGVFRPSGELELLGRSDHQIKYHGYRIEPAEIEQALLKVTGLKECIVLLKQLPDNNNEEIVAYIVATKTEPWWLKELQLLLPEYMIPKTIEAVRVFPLTPNGKVDRKALSF